MDIGPINWLPELNSLPFIVVFIFYLIPVFLIFAFATLIPLMIWGAFWKQFVKDNNASGEKWQKSNIIFIILTSCVALMMYVVWVRWLWTFSG
jgi:hypothetical protein